VQHLLAIKKGQTPSLLKDNVEAHHLKRRASSIP
jgi:hypothetical protein